MKEYNIKMQKFNENKRANSRPAEVKFECDGYGKECDIWSAGVLLYALVYGIMPFRGVTIREIKEKIYNNKIVPYRDNVSEQCQKLIKAMLTYEPEDRISIQGILDHEWFSDMP